MSHRLQVLIPEEMERRLEKASQRRRVSKAAFVREAIKISLNRQSPPRDAVAPLSAMNLPTGDIEQMLAEIDAGRR